MKCQRVRSHYFCIDLLVSSILQTPNIFPVSICMKKRFNLSTLYLQTLVAEIIARIAMARKRY